MQGFQDNIPFQAAVTWLPKQANGLPNEATLLDWKPSADGAGILAAVANGAGQDRYFVPWPALYYLRQSIPAPQPAQAPVAIPPIIPPAGDGVPAPK